MDSLFLLNFKKEPELNLHIKLFYSDDKFYSKSGKKDQPSWSIEGKKQPNRLSPPELPPPDTKNRSHPGRRPRKRNHRNAAGAEKSSAPAVRFTGCALADFPV